MIRYGIISEIDPAKGVARVKFEEDDIVSDWLRISVPNTSENKDERWYDLNEPVWCIMDEHAETGVIGGSYYHEGNTPPIGDPNKRAVTFSDGTKVVYDRATSLLEVSCVGDVIIKCVNATVEASSSVTIDTPESTFTGNVQVDGNLGVNGDATSQGSLNVQGTIKSDTEVQAGVIKLTSHKHTGVQPGGGITATPIP
jgi:phage baseplate assembly protein V